MPDASPVPFRAGGFAPRSVPFVGAATLVGLVLLWQAAASAGLMSGNRNMALYLAVLPAAADPRISLFFGICQFPLFLSPFLLRPLYRRLASSP